MAIDVSSAQSRTLERNEADSSVAPESRASIMPAQTSEVISDQEPSERMHRPSPRDGSKMSASMIFICLILAIFLVALDTTILSTAIPRITDDFKSLRDIGWYAGVYSLTSAVFQLLYGKFYTVFLVKWTFVSGIAVFELGSILCAAAKSSLTLIIGRALAGIGSAGIFSGAFIIVSETIPLRWRPIANAAFGSLYGISSVVGPLLGGLLTDKLSWRWCFWINVPAGVITTVMVILLFKESTKATQEAVMSGVPLSTKPSLASLLKQLNMPSMTVLVGSIISLLLALQWGGAKYRWDNGRILALFVVAGVSSTVFILLQVKQRDQAFVPLHVLRQRTVWACCWYAFNVGSTAAVLVYFLPIWFQAVLGASALRSGILTLPFMMSLVAGSIAAGGMTSLTGQYAPLMIASCIIRAVGVGLLTTISPSSMKWQYIFYQVVFGFGDGIGMQQPLIAVQTALAKTDIAMGVSVLIFCQIMGSAIFVVVGQSVFNEKLLTLLSDISLTDRIDSESIVDAGATAFRNMGLSQPLLQKVVSAFSRAITTTFYIGIALSGASLAGALAVEWKSVKQEQRDEHQATENATDAASTTGIELHELVTADGTQRPSHHTY